MRKKLTALTALILAMTAMLFAGCSQVKPYANYYYREGITITFYSDAIMLEVVLPTTKNNEMSLVCDYIDLCFEVIDAAPIYYANGYRFAAFIVEGGMDYGYDYDDGFFFTDVYYEFKNPFAQQGSDFAQFDAALKERLEYMSSNSPELDTYDLLFPARNKGNAENGKVISKEFSYFALFEVSGLQSISQPEENLMLKYDYRGYTPAGWYLLAALIGAAVTALIFFLAKKKEGAIIKNPNYREYRNTHNRDFWSQNNNNNTNTQDIFENLPDDKDDNNHS